MIRKNKRLRWFESEARRNFWLVHAEAWVRSGIALTTYCSAHRLHRRTMKRWLQVLEKPTPRRVQRVKKPVRTTTARVPASGSRACLAFWSMHFEAQRGSGMNASAYARVHRLSPVYFRRQKLRFKRHPPSTTWRDLHSSGQPTGARSGADLRHELRHDLWISEPAPSPAEPASGLPIKRRRTFSDAQKVAIVTEANEPGVAVSAVARRYQITAPMIFRWRESLGMKPHEPQLFATARVIEPKRRGRRKQSALVLPHLLQCPPGSITVELADGRKVFAPPGSDPEAVRTYIHNQESRP